VEVGQGWTVDPFGGELRDGKIYGRGSCDMKGGLATSIIAARAFLRTAPEGAALQRLVALLGYRPRPAVAAAITLAAIADAKGPAEIPAGTQIRSKGVPGIPPQIFETDADAIADPRLNAWELAPLRPTAFGGLFAFAAGAPGVLPGQTVAFLLDGAPCGAGQVVDVQATRMPDGAEYRVATFTAWPSALTGRPLGSIELRIMTQSAGPTAFAPFDGTPPTGTARTQWMLDSVYPQIAANDVVVLEASGSYSAAVVSNATIASIQLGTAAQPVAGKVTQLTFATPVAMGRVHFRPMPAGRLTNPAAAELLPEDLLASRAGLGPVPSLAGAEVAEMIAAGAGDAGVALAGSVSVDPRGRPTLAGTAITERSAELLAVPVRYHGNLIAATRGETVRDEVLGSGDSTRPWQTFRLKKKPLTYLPDATAPGGAAPELEVRVNGILWRRVESFFGVRPDERVYIVRHDAAGETDIMFGDLTRPPTGTRNILASYRWGAGADLPPPGKVTQLVGRLPGIARLVAPLEARGGADAEAADAVRQKAPRAASRSGRAVSIDDYAALTTGYAGVLAAQVQWVWVPGAQRAGVAAWIINESGDVSAELRAALREAGDPLIPVSVSPAVPSEHALTVEIVADPAYVAADVCTAVAETLEDAESGLLAPANAAIGGALFRSRIAQVAARVEGVADVRRIVVDGADMPTALSPGAGRYLSFILSVGAA
ncbi:MAG: M20/M25/M40 family metallo-hydrolase, partial [Allosphingosinicella sp.]